MSKAMIARFLNVPRVVSTLVIAGALLVCLCVGASAQNPSLNNLQFAAGYVGGNLTQGSYNGYGWAGEILIDNSADFYCVDLYDDVYLGGSYAIVGIHYYDDERGYVMGLQPTDPDQSAGLQLAMWELTYETAVTEPYSVLTGNFQASGFSDEALAFADQVLLQAQGQYGPYYVYDLQQSDGTKAQTLASLVDVEPELPVSNTPLPDVPVVGDPPAGSDPVPEPSSLIGFIGLAFPAGCFICKRR